MQTLCSNFGQVYLFVCVDISWNGLAVRSAYGYQLVEIRLLHRIHIGKLILNTFELFQSSVRFVLLSFYFWCPLINSGCQQWHNVSCTFFISLNHLLAICISCQYFKSTYVCVASWMSMLLVKNLNTFNFRDGNRILILTLCFSLLPKTSSQTKETHRFHGISSS